ncbi:hypothetical protein PHSY_002234 [Pseudozyma hubeiensis SY62]|uniref:Uncharacterized protein n=1 Tax=Pseudozyma hubeiensis (strain SY62) TaxID=1305764 RepID=R9P0J0_PSEHS|nr:hypothetical protein PHSY_002234 [Pseudozyma hubeiensis SY62]GAC94661.1 hypothetical protein PHSY_002234 [Pseudozyma hubeiensis SY62]
MKRNLQYGAPGAQPPAASPTAYGQPPPPAGPAPPLPASGPSQAAYANYGYGSVAPPRTAAAPLNSAVAANSQQYQWNQPWQQPQPQQPYPQPQPNPIGAPGSGHFAAPRPPPQSGPYRVPTGSNAGSPPLHQAAAYNLHQSTRPAPYPYQAQSPSHHQQSPVPSAYGYVPPMSQHQNSAPMNVQNDAQNWPGAYVPGSQAGPPNKKPRHQPPAAPGPQAPSPYGPPGAAPMAPVGGYPAQQPYAWQAPSVASAPHMNPHPVPGPPVLHNRAPSGGGMHANASGTGGVGAPGRGMNRNGAQNRSNASQGASGQRSGLPANPAASVNAASAPNGQVRAWGSKTAVASGTGSSIQAGRRVSSASSARSDKNAGTGSAKRQNAAPQKMVPPDAPRGPNNARNKAAAASSSDASAASTLSNKSSVLVQGSAGSRSAMHDTAAGDVAAADVASAKDNGVGPKRAHTDFRILGLEIKQLDWSWFAPEALAKDAVDSSLDQDSKAGVDGQKCPVAPASDGSTVVTGNDAVDGSVQAEQSVQEEEAHDHVDDENAAPDERSHAQDEEANSEIRDVAEENSDDEDEDEDAEGDDDDDDGDDGQGDAEADDDEHAQSHIDADADANAEGDTTMSLADTDAAASEPQQSMAPTSDPSSELVKASEKLPTQSSKMSKASRAKVISNLRDSTKLRLCFAAMSNPGPEGAPTGPKASLTQEPEVKVEDATRNEVPVDQAQQRPDAPDKVKEEGRQNLPGESGSAEDVELKGKAEDVTIPDADEGVHLTSSGEPQAGQQLKNLDQNDSAKSVDLAPANKDAGVESELDSAVASTGVQEEGTGTHNVSTSQAAVDTTASSTTLNGKHARVNTSPQAKGPPQLSSNRIFLSFAANRKRLAIDAEAIKSVKIHRSEHWIEIRIDVARQADQSARKKGEDFFACRGTLLERRGKGQKNYAALTRSDIEAAWNAFEAANTDHTRENEASQDEHLELPPFFRLDGSSSEVVLQVHLDPSAPLPEPAWLRKNDVDDLLASLQRGSTAVAQKFDASASAATVQHVWAGKIEVMDPDPPPSMSTFLYEWVKESFIGSQRERRKFVDELLGRKKRERGAEETAKVKVEGDGEADLSKTPTKTEDAAEQAKEETEGQRDARVARAFVEIVLRLIKGERISAPSTGTSSSTDASSHFSRALSSASYTSSTTHPGLFMLGLLDLCLPADVSADAANKVRAKVDEMLMEMPRATLVKAVDLTWKDVVESGRKGGAATAVAAASQSASANVKTAGRNRGHQHGGRHQHQRQRQHGGGGSGGGGGRPGKRKRG